MSGFIDLEPPPIALGAMSAADDDGAWVIDATANMTRRGTTISSIGTAVVQRQDGVALDADDIAISDETVVASPTPAYVNGAQVTVQPGYGWTFRAATNGNVATYDIGFPLTLDGGDVIVRWVTIPVIAKPG